MTFTSTLEDHFSEEVLDLYDSSFSDIEKIPLENLDRALKGGAELRLFHDGRFIGFTYCFTQGDRLFLVYFATIPSVRGSGYGSRIMGALRELHPGKRMFLVLEPEDPDAADSEMRRRRHGFYIRNRCRDTGVKVISDDAVFDTMFIQGELSEKEMVDTIRDYEDIHNGRAR